MTQQDNKTAVGLCQMHDELGAVRILQKLFTYCNGMRTHVETNTRVAA